ncbi:type III-A CRISPR-associated protein Cas10/Csm1 [uncultured Ilyobacter sp.]|uniref:type III-A CRISPR-associated protein Cas10/Csm1 n=1 Tax=uncultured Ilyobacter sp. TaxID=544433 RepID=UPI0029C700BF|nr:type III-A CRISPR-associated protein Cas10/Csm1 [uncultured Ilyobacter sp.]
MLRINEEWQKVALGALLHDIGKMIHRHNDYKNLIPELGTKHQSLSVWFYKELVKHKIVNDDELITTIIQRHHEDSRIDEQFRVQELKDDNLKKLSLIVSRADNYSSSERSDEEADYSKGSNNYKTTPLQSVFSRVSLEECIKEISPSFFKLSPLDSEGIFSKENHRENYSGDLKKLIESFMDEVYRIRADDFHTLYNNLLFLIEKYTWCIASDTQGKVNDIPLYDHLKTTSAIALSSYRYQMEFEKVTQSRIKNGDTENQFLIIGGDLSGIQSFIYNLGSQSRGAKRLRARSFYVKTLSEILSYRIIKDLELTQGHIVLQAGGKFHIIAPNTNSVRIKLKKIEKEVLDEIFLEFKGEIFIALDAVEASGKMLNGNYNEITEQLEIKLNKKKKTKYSEKIMANPVFENPIYGDGQGARLCPVCQRELFNKGEMCKSCEKQVRIGSKLPHTEYMAITNSGKGDFSFLGLGVMLIEDKKNIPENLFLLVNYKEENPLYVYPEIRGSYGAYTPLKGREIMEFEEIAEKATGVKNLGVLKADVDNLGNIFAVGLKEQSISRVANMSKLLDSFFSKFIEDKIRESRVKPIEYKGIALDLSNFYLVYAGGDDLLIVAPWNELIYFSKWLRDKFSEFTKNENFTISCGLHIMHHKDPFYIASEKAGELEEMSKTSGKNGLSIWDRYIHWDDFDRVFIEYGERLSKYSKKDYKEGKEPLYSQSFLYRLLKYTAMAEKYLYKKDINSLSFISKFNYDVERNLKGKIMKVYNKTEAELEYVPQWSLIKNAFYIIDKEKNINKKAIDFLGRHMRVALNYAVRKNREGDNID